MNKNIEEAVKKINEFSLYVSTIWLEHKKTTMNVHDIMRYIEEIKSLLKSEDKDTSCPTCRDSIERFELINYPDTYMCDGCGLTRGSVLGKWNQVFKNLIWKQQGGEG